MQVKRQNWPAIKDKAWYKSRLIKLGAAAILGALADGVLQGWSWRQILVAAVGALVVVLRVDTKGPVTK